MRYLFMAVLLCIAMLMTGCDEPVSQILLDEVKVGNKLPDPDFVGRNVQSPIVVKAILLIPSDEFPLRTEKKDALTLQIDSIIKETQELFASEMARLNHGRLTFNVVKENGKVSIDFRKLTMPRSHYETHDFPAIESYHIDYAQTHGYPPRRTIRIFFADLNMLHGGRGGGSTVHLFNGGWNVRVLAHEIGHAVGLEHDNRDNYRYIMSQFASVPYVLSKGAGEWLSRSQAFNGGTFPLSQGSERITARLIDNTSLTFKVAFHIDVEWTYTHIFEHLRNYEMAVLLDDTFGRWHSVISFAQQMSKRYEEGVVVVDGWEYPQSIVYTIDFDGEIPPDIEHVTLRLKSKHGLSRSIDSIPVQ